MKNKIFLSSMLIMSVAPAMAETFPSNGLMQENKTYDNAATETNMDGVYEGTVDANAEYTDILYNIVAGNYLAAGSDATNGTQCPANSYCPGLTNAKYNETDNQGLNTCPSGYALSASGSSSQNDCYRTCTNADVAHSTGTMNGGYYYGDNNQCVPTACVNGWHLKQGLNLTTVIGTGAGENSAAVNGSGSFSEMNFDGQGAKGASYYGLSTSNPNTWAVDCGTNGMLIGQGRCSTQAGTNNSYAWTNPTTHTTSELGSEGGKYCYCNVTGYTPNGGTLQAVLSPWVFHDGYYNASMCANLCARNCANDMRGADSYGLAFRAALVGSVQPGLAMCEANVININWSDASQTDIDANNAGTATYGSDVRTPVKAQTIKGKTFKGWRFSKPTQVQSCSSITNKSTCSSNSNCRWNLDGEICVQSCGSITDQTTCVKREQVSTSEGFEHCYWENGSCREMLTHSGSQSPY